MKQITTSVGFQDAKGNVVANGFLMLQLSQNVEITATGGQVTTQALWLPLDVNGKITPQNILFNDEASPAGTVYYAKLFGSNGMLQIQDFGGWSISGASADLSTVVPTSPSVGAPGVVFTTPAATQTIVQPTGTSLNVNRFENIRFADQFGLTSAGIQAAHDDCPDGGMVFMPAGTYIITSQINITKRLTLAGAGRATVLQVAAGLGATVDVIQINPSATFIGGSMDGVTLRDFYITPISGTPGRSGIMIDGTNAPVSSLVIERVRIDGLGSYAFNIQNAAGLVTGTPFLMSIRNCGFQGGMNLVNAGDSLTIQDSVFSNAATPTSKDIIVSQIGAATTNGGAHGFNFIGNNVTLTGGIIIQNAWQGLMMGNDIETTGNSTEANGAMVDIQGNASANVQDFTLAYNYLAGGTVGGISGPGFRVDRATGTKFIGNYFTGSVSPFVKTTANADRTDLLFNRIAPDNPIATWLSDLGTNTRVDFHHPSTGVPTIAGSGLAFSSIAGTTGVFIAPTQVKVNPTNGVLGFSSGDPSGTAVDTVAWRGVANQWVFGNTFGDTSGAILYTQNGQIEAVAPAGVAGRTVTWADSTAHRLKMNNNNTGASLIVGVDGATSQKAETAADTNVLTFTPPALAGTYRIRFDLALSAANAATLGWTATWKDSNGTAKSPTNLSLFQVGTASPALTFTTSTTDEFYGDAAIEVDNSATAIVIKLTFSGTSFAGKASATIERLI